MIPVIHVLSDPYLFTEGPKDKLLAKLARLLSRSPVKTFDPVSLAPLLLPLLPLGNMTSPKTPVLEEAIKVITR